jgi:hypothetical protein
MSPMDVKRYKSAYVMHPKGGYQEPIVVTTPILNHRYSHYVKPNKVILKYPDFKKHIDVDAHVKMFNFVIKENAKSS